MTPHQSPPTPQIPSAAILKQKSRPIAQRTRLRIPVSHAGGTEQALQLLLESINEGVANLSLEGTVLYCNPKFAELIGLTLEQILGAPFERFIAPSERSAFREWLSRVEPDATQAEFGLLPSPGANHGKPVLFSRRKVELDGSEIVSMVATDLSERKAHEQLLRRENAELEKRVAERTAELTKANEALSLAKTKLTENARDLENLVAERTAALRESIGSLEEFCYTIAHDLRAPLRTMHGFSSALLEDFASSLNPTASDYAERIVRAATRMDEQIRALLAYGRLNSTDMPLTSTDVCAILEQLRQAEEFRDANISLRTPIPHVLANPTALRQVLHNLIANAVKFVAPGVLPCIEISAQENAGWVRLTVSDNGIGIEPRYHQRIFRVFERVSTGNYPGTGIGLAIVQKGVDRMGGRVGLDSAPGKGSRFWVDLRKSGG